MVLINGGCCSAGGPIALDLMIRHPELVRAAVLQEPSIFSVLPDPMVALAPRRALIEAALPLKGPRGAVEALLRYLNDDDVFAAIPPDILERMLGNADTILTIEGPGFAGWRPSSDRSRPPSSGSSARTSDGTGASTGPVTLTPAAGAPPGGASATKGAPGSAGTATRS